MIRIVVNREQAERIRAGDQAVELVDEEGQRIAVLSASGGWSAAEIEDATRRAAGTRGGRTTAEVLERLRATSG